MPRQTRCIDCNAKGRVTPRPALRPGPRCEECWRERRRAVSKAAHANRIEKVYEITEEEYEAILEAQGGRCFICQWATGKRRRLAVDHDHDCDQGHPRNLGCRKCIRGLLCNTCNKVVIGRYDIAALERAIKYLKRPPARAVLSRIMEVHDGFE